MPIIAVTANARSEQIQTALDVGMVSRLIRFPSHHFMRRMIVGMHTRITVHRLRKGAPAYKIHALVSSTTLVRGTKTADISCVVQDDVVSKPFRIPELVPKIEELMAKYPMPSSNHKTAKQP